MYIYNSSEKTTILTFRLSLHQKLTFLTQEHTHTHIYISLSNKASNNCLLLYYPYTLSLLITSYYKTRLACQRLDLQ